MPSSLILLLNNMRTRHLIALAVVAAITLPTMSLAAVPGLPKLQGVQGSGFGGFITKVTPCICADLGMMITVSGPFGGDFLYSFSKPPQVKVGSFFMVGGPILGGGDKEGACGTKIHRGCTDKKNATILKYVGGIIQ